MLNQVLTILAIISLIILLVTAIFRFKYFFFVLLIIKPFIDITVNSVIIGDFNALEISGALVFGVALIKYIQLNDKTRLFNHSVIWLFLSIHLLSFALALNNSDQTWLNGAKYFLRLFNSYFIYFLAATDLMRNHENRTRVYFTLWYTIFAAGIITIVIYFSGLSNSDTTRGLVRYNGLYNDPGTPSYLAVICILISSLCMDILGKKLLVIYRLLYYITWASSLFILYITLTKSALLMFVVFLFLWFGMHKRQFYLIIPTIIIAAYLSFTMISGVSTRFETEVNFIEQGDSETAKSIGTGRVNRWENLLDQFQTEFDAPTKLIGTSKNFAAHNQYIAYLMQIGIIGLFVFLLFIFRFLTRLYRIYSITHNPQVFAAFALLIMYLVYAFTGHPFDYTTLLWYLMILLSIINVYAFEVRQKSIQKLKQISVEVK